MATQIGATRSIVRLFDDRDHALSALRDLERAGFTQDEVSLMASDAAATTNDETGSGAGMGATLGTLLGGGAGLLAGIGALAIPGMGPIVAAGWLAAVLTGGVAGAAAGRLFGSLVGSGVDEQDAHVYAEGIRRGGTLVSVRGAEARIVEAERLLADHKAVDVSVREAEYRAAGWSGHVSDSTNPPGTQASRGVDAALGTNISGAHPENERHH